MNNQYTLDIDNNQVTSEKSVKLLGNKLSFNEYVSSLCKKQAINLTQ